MNLPPSLAWRTGARFALFLLAAWMIFNVVQTVGYVTADYSGLPIADYWREIDLWPQYKAGDLPVLWVQHNAQRIVFPEIVFAADLLLLHGRFYLPIALSALCYLGIWCVLAWAVYSHKTIPSPVREIAVTLAGIVMLWKGCSAVIAVPFQLTLTLMQIMGMLALAFLAQLSETGSGRYLAALIAAAVVSTYSVGNGMLIWPILIGGALLLRIRIRQLLVLAVSAALSIGAYFIHYRFIPGDIGQSLRLPAMEPGHLCSYLGMPFGANGPPALGVSLGVVNLLLAAACFLVAWRRRLLKTRLSVVLFGSYTLVLLSAMFTTLEWQYLSMGMVAWASLAIALLWLAGGLRSFAAAGALAAFFGWGFHNAGHGLESSRLYFQNAQVAATMLLNNVFDPVTAGGISAPAYPVLALSQRLRDDRKSIFARGEDKWLGHDIQSLHPQTSPVAGKVTRVVPVPGGLEIVGWADTSDLTRDHAVLFVDDRNKIAGFARQPAAHLPPELAGWDLPADRAFVGFVSLAQPVAHLAVYVRTFHGKLLQPLDGQIDVPTFTAITADDLKPLPGIAWQPGAATPAPANHCLVLPERHSPSIYGLSLEVEDADTKQVLALLPLLEGRSIWKRWRIPLPETTRNFTIKANQEAAGQWLTIAAPRQCP